MNCPKCGFAQEQRLDCKKCGVVFSKYYALYPSTRPAAPNGLDDPIEQELLERERKNAIADLEMQIRELNARFEEVEFERAERRQLRTDLETVQRELHENLDRTSFRLEEIQKSLSATPGECVETVEEKTENPGDEVNLLSAVLEKEDESARKISELQDQLSEVRGQVSEMRRLLDELQQIRTVEPPQNEAEQDLHTIRENLNQLFSLITKGTEPRP
jgi:chromosome segregation ATPase